MELQEPTYASNVPIEELPTIELSDRWQQICYHIGKARALTYENYEGADQYNDKTLSKIHRIGVTGEIAMQILFGVEPEIYIARLGDEGFDFRSPAKNTVDVKSTKADTERPVLSVSAETEQFADVYALAHVLDWATVRPIGWVYGYEVRNRSSKPFPTDEDKDSYVVKHDELRVIE